MRGRGAPRGTETEATALEVCCAGCSARIRTIPHRGGCRSKLEARRLEAMQRDEILPFMPKTSSPLGDAREATSLSLLLGRISSLCMASSLRASSFERPPPRLRCPERLRLGSYERRFRALRADDCTLDHHVRAAVRWLKVRACERCGCELQLRGRTAQRRRIGRLLRRPFPTYNVRRWIERHDT